MISFESDYTTGAHPEILKKLAETNLVSCHGYGSDEFCASATEKIRKACKCDDAEVFYISGGTQTNEVVISTMLADYEGVIAADTGHISAHEAGAVEYTGHKVMTIPGHMGKIDATELRRFISDFYADANHSHMVYPGMVYISHPSEYGTIYSKAELTAISDICREYKIPLFMDGARLGYGLMSHESDLDLADIARLCDVFYIGGTKVGALCGEAVVFTKKNMPKHFLTMVKRRGALLAKGRLFGVQFDALFTDDLYFRIGEYAIEKAEELKKILKKKGYRFFYETSTNQQFVIFEDSQLEKLSSELAVGFWEKYDDTHTVVRFATSWSTSDDDMRKLEEIL